jgi:hypothetical protein
MLQLTNDECAEYNRAVNCIRKYCGLKPFPIIKHKEPTQITAELEEYIKNRYMDGKNINEISAELDIYPKKINKIVKGVEKNFNTKKKVYELYNQGYRIDDLAIKFSVTSQTIKNWIISIKRRVGKNG